MRNFQFYLRVKYVLNYTRNYAATLLGLRTLAVLYTADLVRVIEDHGLRGHLFADDTLVIGTCPPRDVSALQYRISTCLDDVSYWMRSNRLQLNTSKMVCYIARRHIGSTTVLTTS